MREAELLVEIEDDLKDYGRGVAKNSFNVYRVFAREYRERAAEEMAAFIAEVEERYLALRDMALDSSQFAAHLARNEEQGSAGPAMAPSTGRWDIPVPILEEQLLRSLSARISRPPMVFVPCGVLAAPDPGTRLAQCVAGNVQPGTRVRGPFCNFRHRLWLGLKRRRAAGAAV